MELLYLRAILYGVWIMQFNQTSAARTNPAKWVKVWDLFAYLVLTGLEISAIWAIVT